MFLNSPTPSPPTTLQDRKGPGERRGADQRSSHLRHRRHPGGEVGADAGRHPGRKTAGKTPLRGGEAQGTSTLKRLLGCVHTGHNEGFGRRDSNVCALTNQR